MSDTTPQDAKIERLTADIERLEDSFVVMMRASEANLANLTAEVESWRRVAKDLNRELVSAGQIVAERDATLVDLQLAAQKALKDAAHEIALQDVKIERMTYERSHPFGDAIQTADKPALAVSAAMCDHDVFDTWVGTHRCADMPWRVWFGPIMVGRISGPAFAHYGECGWTVGGLGLFAAWTGRP